MRELTIDEIIEATQGRVLRQEGETRIKGISTDSRTIEPGMLFVALQGPSYDGHEFCQDALDKGAEAVLRGRPIDNDLMCTTIIVDDTLKALGDIGSYCRRCWSGNLIAVTGSTGKTSVKEMIRQLLSVECIASLGNFNNLIGVPKTLLRLCPSASYAVVEMGMSAEGEIARLMDVADPHVGVITNIGYAHLEYMGSIENIARAKSEMGRGLRPFGVLVLNRDDRFYDYLRRNTMARVVTFGQHALSDFRIENVSLADRGTMRCKLVVRGSTSYDVALPLYGRHNAENIAAAAAALDAVGVSLDDVVPRASGIGSLLFGRMQRMAIGGSEFFFDAYNASPASVGAAIRFLGELSSQKRKVFVFAGMNELGHYAQEAHRGVGAGVAVSGIDELVCIGYLGQQTAQAAMECGMPLDAVHVFSDHEQAGAFLKKHMRRHTQDGQYLLKGSRASRMEDLIKLVHSS